MPSHRPLAIAASLALLSASLTVSLSSTVSATASPTASAPPAAAVVTAGHSTPHTVTFDDYSLLVDGKRLNIWSGEFAYWRLPSPSLWRDVLQKMKAGGFNAVSIYFDWAYHSPQPGVYDFSGVRDVDQLLDIANQVGIYVIARPGPYINAETDSGGFPGWLTTTAGRARSTAPDYLAAAKDWLSHIDAILARHQVTNGTGSVLLYQVENEFYDTSDTGHEYMAALERQARADGITVPFTGNDKDIFAGGTGAVGMDGTDIYPQGFNCSAPTAWKPVRDLSSGHPAGFPLIAPEFQGGSIDGWGGVGYQDCSQLTGPDFEDVFYKDNIAVGATMQNFYMTFGGTSWGWEPGSTDTYTSYDYGAPISESRQLTPKYDEDKLLGDFVQSVAPLTKTDPLATPQPTDPALIDTARINPDDGTQFHVLRHADATSTATDSTHISLDLSAHSAYTLDDSDPSLVYSGNWSHQSAAATTITARDYQRTESYSSTAGDSVTIPFTGSAVRWIGPNGKGQGIAQVYLDGAPVATVDTYAAAKNFQQILYSASNLSSGPHTLKIVVTGTHDAASAGSAVSIDAIDVPSPSTLTYPVVPQQPGTSISLDGRDSKIILADYAMDGQQLRYSTSELMTHATIGDRDVALFYGAAGSDGETVLHYASQPKVTVLDGSVSSVWDPSRGDLRLNYTHNGLTRVLISGGGTRPLLLLLTTPEIASTFWQQQTSAGPVLVRGPELLRTASQDGVNLRLTGDTTQAGPVEVFAADSRQVLWNSARVELTKTPSGTLLGSLPGPRAVSLPALTNWKYSAESPESQPSYDDSTWTVANHTSSNSPTPPVTEPVLFADDYGFHYGDVWYRGHFTATGAETGITLSALTGNFGQFSLWVNGVFLTTVSTDKNGSASQTFTFPPGALKPGADNVVSVLVQNMGHSEDYHYNDQFKQARGLTGAALTTAPGTPAATAALTWRIQGGNPSADPVRGPLNSGGLYGERNGWSLPGFPDQSWTPVQLPASSTTPGIAWYRTSFALNLPQDQDTSLGIKIADTPTRHYRAELYVNGWMLGLYANDLGPQHDFVIPDGILHDHGPNTIAIATWNADTTTGGLGTVSLESFGTALSPLHVAPVNSPRYQG